MGEAGLKPPHSCEARFAALLHLLLSQGSQVKASGGPSARTPRLSTAPLEARGRAVRPLLRSPASGCSPRSGPAGGARAQTDGSPDARFRSLEVIPSPGERPAVPEGNASRVLPRALRKTPPASAADMASEFPASPEYPGWEAAAPRGTAQPPGPWCPAGGGALCSVRGGRAVALGSAARGAASAA